MEVVLPTQAKLQIKVVQGIEVAGRICASKLCSCGIRVASLSFDANSLGKPSTTNIRCACFSSCCQPSGNCLRQVTQRSNLRSKKCIEQIKVWSTVNKKSPLPYGRGFVFFKVICLLVVLAML